MIDFVFTLDYEIYGNGAGTLKELVYEPGEQLKEIFRKWDARFVAFVEVAEFERIEACGADPSMDLVKRQIQSFHEDGFEIALHLHPQWCNARYEKGRWWPDYSEYNLCTLPRTRITEIVERSLDYLRYVVGQSDFTPLSFRAGNWLFQPTKTAASIMAEKGIKVDSSVFKGGLQHNHGLDYRPALKNDYYWPFRDDVNEPDATGPWIEVPIYTEMVPPWRMSTRKRLSFGNKFSIAGGNAQRRLNRIRDFLRFQYPLKLDFCRMTLDELTAMMGRLIREDRERPDVYRPLVAIGHTKDLIDPGTVDAFLGFLRTNAIPVSTFETIYPKLLPVKDRTASVR
ncbi:MAG: hypothetical protein LAN18_06480 [Acidobacteriia bacterium]|nr:hypothetical protein [Terriglobia bacterium]